MRGRRGGVRPKSARRVRDRKRWRWRRRRRRRRAGGWGRENTSMEGQPRVRYEWRGGVRGVGVHSRRAAVAGQRPGKRRAGTSGADCAPLSRRDTRRASTPLCRILSRYTRATVVLSHRCRCRLRRRRRCHCCCCCYCLAAVAGLGGGRERDLDESRRC